MLAPNDSDWDNIAAVTGNATWASQYMRPYFHRLEQCRYVVRPSDGGQDPLDHGFDGWQPTEMLDTSNFTADPQLNAILQNMASQIGTSTTMSDYAQNKLDPNAKAVLDNETEGLYAFPMSRLNGARQGVRERIVATAAALPNNLVIMNNALVTRVLFNGATAIGVEYLQGNSIYRASPLASASGPEPGPRQQLMAAREVVISAGTFNSPQILKLSGVGPAAELSKFGIKQVVNLPGVGANLQDRYEVGVVTELDQNLTILQKCTPQQPGDPCFADFLQGKGIYTTNLSALASIRKSNPAKMTRDLVVFCAAGDFHGYYPGWENETYGTPNQFTMLILKAHTANRAGTVTLSSADPRDPPVINFHYFAEGSDTAGDDLNAVVQGVQLARQLNAQLGQMVIGERLPGPSVQSAQDIADFVSNEAWGHHASCSNKMGPASDPMAVVDSEFNVHGTKNLRVVDASVFPQIPGYYVMIPIMMISEKASDVILYDATH
jgi:choline dehydrogenase